MGESNGSGLIDVVFVGEFRRTDWRAASIWEGRGQTQSCGGLLHPFERSMRTPFVSGLADGGKFLFGQGLVDPIDPIRERGIGPRQETGRDRSVASIAKVNSTSSLPPA